MSQKSWPFGNFPSLLVLGNFWEGKDILGKLLCKLGKGENLPDTLKIWKKCNIACILPKARDFAHPAKRGRRPRLATEWVTGSLLGRSPSFWLPRILWVQVPSRDVVSFVATKHRTPRGVVSFAWQAKDLTPWGGASFAVLSKYFPIVEARGFAHPARQSLESQARSPRVQQWLFCGMIGASWAEYLTTLEKASYWNFYQGLHSTPWSRRAPLYFTCPPPCTHEEKKSARVSI